MLAPFGTGIERFPRRGTPNRTEEGGPAKESAGNATHRGKRECTQQILACPLPLFAHFVFPEYRRGNLNEQELVQIVESNEQRGFGSAKSATLPRQCLACDVLFACRGECPKNRFATTADGEVGLNYLCPSYLKFFRHINPAMQRITSQLHQHFQANESRSPNTI